ncbi:hypothetical protein GF369_04715 [Candidatus Peregrinibacteria bacterium]|nr:hypothetical protein [Candidatus Peregrinibacteria bacterium]
MNKSSVSTTHARPWQGTLLGVFNIIGLVFLGIAMVVILIMITGGGAMLSQMAPQTSFPLPQFIGTMGVIVILPLLAIFVLGVFITLGIFKGQKWAIIVSIVFTILSLITSVSQAETTYIIVNGILLYAEIVCLKDPFYNT